MPAPPDPARHHSARRRAGWAAYRRLMLAMLAATGLVLVAAFGWLAATGTPMDGHFVAAVAIAVAASLMLSAALMGLMFLSSRLGVDDAVWRDERPGARRR